uniref:Uncharacterized protein n=1 Tax=Opuntia streptacantha TaxID=393608 RepID=A0A7C9CLW7_OPUST
MASFPASPVAVVLLKLVFADCEMRESKRVLRVLAYEPDGSWKFWSAQPLYTKSVYSKAEEIEQRKRRASEKRENWVVIWELGVRVWVLGMKLGCGLLSI